MFEISFNIVLSLSKLVVSKCKCPPITLMCGPRQGFPNTFLAKFYATMNVSVLYNNSYFIAKEKTRSL